MSYWNIWYEHTHTHKPETWNVMTNNDFMTEKSAWWQWNSRDCLWGDVSIWEAIHRSQNILFANRGKLKKHIKAVKQYLTRKEWKKGEQSCSLEELQKKSHRTKKGLRERKKKREAKEYLGLVNKNLNTIILLSVTITKLSHQNWNIKLCFHPLLS